jgi:predicted small lipoprotein YifL
MNKLLAVLLVLFAVAACGEREPQARLFGPPTGRDTTAWSNAPFKGDETAWQRNAYERAQHETEYEAR